ILQSHFFFQAEDGIRDFHVTGVQTCALPIYQNNEFKYKETKLDKIALGGDIGVAQMDGEIEIFSKDPTFGNGFRGMIDVGINALGGPKIDAVLQVGNVNNFNYWYFDVMVNLGNAGFNIPGTMASIYGLGGGAYGNMT